MAELTKPSLPSPFLIPTISWCAGIGLATILHLPILLIVLTGILSILLAVIFRFKLPFPAIIFLLAGCLRLTLSIDKPPTPLQQILVQRESITQSCTGKVIKILNSRYGTYLVRLSSIRKIPVHDKAIMYYDKELLPGDTFDTIGKITILKPDPVLDATSFYISNRNTQTQFVLTPVYKLTKITQGKEISFERLRYHLLHSIDTRLGDSAPFAKALLLNDRTEDRDWIQQLIQGGLLHLIAISGLHVLLFYFLFVTLLNVFLPRRVSELIFLLLMIVYAGLCQWSAPIMRAIVMILLFVIARIAQRKVSPLQIICLSLFIITLIDPVQLFSIGLQLSYLCVIILAYAIPGIKYDNTNQPMWKRKLNKAAFYTLDMVIVSVIITLALLPLTMFYFQRGSFNGIIGNLLGIPFMSLLLPLTLLIVIIPVKWLIFHWLKAAFDLLYVIFQKWVVFTAGLPFYVDAVNLSLAWLIVVYLVVAVIVIRVKSGLTYRKLTYAMLILALLVTVYSQIPRHKPFTLTVFNAGLGDCSLVQYPKGQTLMIDTGPKRFTQDNNDSGWFGYKPRNWFSKNKITTLDLLVLSHLDDDHRGGLSDVFHNLKVRRIIISRHDAESTLWQQLKQSIDMREAKLTVISDTMSFVFANSGISFLHPDKDYQGNSENDNSLVMRLDYKGFSALFPGDISASAEERLVEEYPAKLDCDFLKVPHHGSRYSSSVDFIRAVSPGQACITAPLHNRFHFPDRETMTRFRSYGIEPQLTGNGSVVISIR